MAITVDIDPAFDSFDQEIIKNSLHTVFHAEGAVAENVSLIFGGDALLNELKKEYFDQDHFTDVIAFRLNNYEEKIVEGEIYISIPRARGNAEEFNEPFTKEVCRLVIHGGLHLLNYDDRTEAEKENMTKKEDEFLQQCNWQDLIIE
ncbi:MAG TPA: rRNA maturation RNase YbeY [Candidatus Marinimicrobia bacterium]|jgi:rRNA maturation RNase YbeY|nr:rRNA maturation RNase YbeY [Candidatus Neomarinimicrobiota bacterium]MDP6276227.1 rRNA maturation RNase YbeY [Candidatus Neomarinimicrobiota bacterium]MDP7217501.1 rRNA maturation RNase YbeY [Candidatus Neomarinimicrobiota bacterium]MDP7437349.1 rRNA maturation RNase YbeY [Candidatus Neomarinimicrobiota bacterium]HBN45970.1 rRNA maturation RNase YbeY [Candidatus Neomarinimicrobiota bacterium]|tara:strand:+ start:3200 stop:3640 length:441 start_codon:yes stop_codon:yes gene_type:complete